MAATAAQALGASDAGDDEKPKPTNTAEWVKVQTSDVALRDERQLVTPGLFDRDQMKVVTFPADGTPVDLGLPHDGKDKDDKPNKPLMGLLKGGFVWLDLNGNGKQDAKEASPLPAGGSTIPFVWNATYDDGTSGPYIFKLVDLGEPNKAAIVRMCAKQAKVGAGTSLMLVDDDGNGRYDDLFRDVVVVAGLPPTLLSHQVFVDGKLHELLVHAAGQTVEVRPLNEPVAPLNLFKEYKEPAKGEKLTIHTLIVAGKDGAFAFDAKVRELNVPLGAYDTVYGIFSRGEGAQHSEWVLMKKGERTSFNVEAGKAATPAWGAPIEAKYDLSSDGKSITVSAPVFLGSAGEVYLPQDFKKVNVKAALAQIYLDKRFNNKENILPVTDGKYDVKANNDLIPVVFKWEKTDELQVAVTYASGILGSVATKQRIQFVARRK
ncbi:MAG: hypothetical protein KIS92_19920 [Planctomycetota bacterium]|nr:hypothetical protein [Planctomycetota bacterium]